MNAETDRRPALRSALVAGGLVALILVATLWPALSGFHLRGDDYPLVLHSASYHIDASDAVEWVTEGYSDYFENYPGWQTATAFVRPVQNGFIWLLSLTVPLLGERVYLAGNLLVLTVTAGLMAALVNRLGAGSVLAVMAGAAYALSPAFHLAMTRPSFGTNLLAAALVLGSLWCLLGDGEHVPSRRYVVAALLQCAAVAAHETAVAAPFMALGLLVVTGRRPRRRSVAAPLLAPLVLLAGLRLGLERSGEVYALRGGVDAVLVQARFFIAQLTYPWDAFGFAGARSGLGPFDAAAFVLGALAALAIGVALATRIWRARRDAPAVLGILLLIASAPAPALLNPIEPRFFALPLAAALIALSSSLPGSRALSRAAIGTALAASLVSFGWWVAAQVPATVDEMAASRDQYVDTKTRIHEARPSTVVVVNDRYGLEGAGALVEMAAAPLQVEVRVVNTLFGPPDPEARVSIAADAKQLRVRNAVGESQSSVFLPAVVDFDVPTRHFRYRALDGRGDAGGFEATGNLPPGTTLIVGADPATGDFLDVDPLRR